MAKIVSEITDDELKNIMVTHGRKYDFIHKGKKYIIN
jgi:hypothetical protein